MYTGTVADQLWIKQHYRYSQMWSNVEMCHECFAQNAVGPLNSTACVEFPPRTNATYMASDGAKMSPLAKVIGFHMSMTRPELMHVGPLGCMPGFVGSALTELADEGFFGFTDVTSWQVRFGSQLKVAFIDFNEWARRHNQSHSLKTLTRARLSLKTRSAWLCCLRERRTIAWFCAAGLHRCVSRIRAKHIREYGQRSCYLFRL